MAAQENVTMRAVNSANPRTSIIGRAGWSVETQARGSRIIPEPIKRYTSRSSREAREENLDASAGPASVRSGRAISGRRNGFENLHMVYHTFDTRFFQEKRRKQPAVRIAGDRAADGDDSLADIQVKPG